MVKPLISELPYPSCEGLYEDPVSVRIISAAYATSSGELNAVLQYQLHAVQFEYGGNKKTAELLRSICIAEMHHLNILAEVLLRLGAQPVYSLVPPVQYNFYSSKFVSSSTELKNMLEDDIMGEKYSIYVYERMLSRLKNDLLKRIVCRLIDDERLHLEALKESYKGFSG